MSPEPFDSRAKASPAKRWEKGYVDENGHADATKWQISAIYIPFATRVHLSGRKQGQLAQLVREGDLFCRVKRQIKTVLTNVVVEYLKSRMSNAKTRQR